MKANANSIASHAYTHTPVISLTFFVDVDGCPLNTRHMTVKAEVTGHVTRRKRK